LLGRRATPRRFDVSTVLIAPVAASSCSNPIPPSSAFHVRNLSLRSHKFIIVSTASAIQVPSSSLSRFSSLVSLSMSSRTPEPAPSPTKSLLLSPCLSLSLPSSDQNLRKGSMLVVLVVESNRSQLRPGLTSAQTSDLCSRLLSSGLDWTSYQSRTGPDICT